MMPITLILPADRPDSANWASIAAQIEAGLARVVQERRREERRSRKGRDEGDRIETRGDQRRRAEPLPVSVRVVLTP